MNGVTLVVFFSLIALALGGLSKHKRAKLVEDAINEAHLSVRIQEEEEARSSMFRSNRSCSPFAKLRRGFKRGSNRSLSQGKARNLLMSMVRRAEGKIMESERALLSNAQDKQVKAEGLAKQLFHKPGTVLTQEEFSRIYEASNCLEVTSELPRKCNQAVTNTFRTLDGTCNNLDSPLLGAAATKFRRLLNPWYEDGCDIPFGRFQHILAETDPSSVLSPLNPSARLVSSEIIKPQDVSGAPFTHMMMQWGQFLDHDMDLGPEPEIECNTCEITEECEPIRVPEGDAVFDSSSCLGFRRSVPVCGTGSIENGVEPREQLNDLTPFIDGSNVYGSSDEVLDMLVEFDDEGEKTGFMKTSQDGKELPLADLTAEHHVLCMTETPCYDAGDVRVNEQAGLVTMHTLFVVYHNVVAKELININPHWTGERVFQETRKIIGALMQKITYRDYLPKILGDTWMSRLIGDYIGYDSTIDPQIPNSFATAAYRYGHSLIQPVFDTYSDDSYSTSEPLDLVDSFFSSSTYSNLGLAAILRGLITQNALQVDEYVNANLKQRLFAADDGPGLDLVSLNIQRQRDHGMPKLGVWQSYCHKRYFSDFENEAPFPPKIARELTLARLLRIYGYTENADLWVGGMAEEALPGSVLGPTFACIFAETFRNVRDGDRFWYGNTDAKNGNNGPIFTPDQMQVIEDVTLSDVICASTDIRSIQLDAFLEPDNGANSRQACSGDLGSLDLTKWEEETCFIGVDTINAPDNSIITVTYKNPFDQQYVVTKPVEEEDSRLCFAISCPGYRRLNIKILRGGAPGVCEAIGNPGLPADVNDNDHIYAVTGNGITREDHLRRQFGIFQTKAGCENTNANPAAAVTFECDDTTMVAAASVGKIDCGSTADQPECADEEERERASDSNKDNRIKTHIPTAYEQEKELMKELEKELDKW